MKKKVEKYTSNQKWMHPAVFIVENKKLWINFNVFFA